MMTFRAICPGRCRGRSTHVHHKVFLDESNVPTGQFVVPDAVGHVLECRLALA